MLSTDTRRPTGSTLDETKVSAFDSFQAHVHEANVYCTFDHKKQIQISFFAIVNVFK